MRWLTLFGFFLPGLAWAQPNPEQTFKEEVQSLSSLDESLGIAKGCGFMAEKATNSELAQNWLSGEQLAQNLWPGNIDGFSQFGFAQFKQAAQQFDFAYNVGINHATPQFCASELKRGVVPFRSPGN